MNYRALNAANRSALSLCKPAINPRYYLLLWLLFGLFMGNAPAFAQITPTTLPDSGGQIKVEFTGTYVTAKVTAVGPSGFSTSTNVSSSPAFLSLPANITSGTQTYTVSITYTYKDSSTSTATLGTVSVKPFVITSATLTPTVLPDSGGNVRIEFTGDYVTAKVTVVGPGGYSLTANSSSGVANLPLPANTTDKPQVYTFTITDYYGGTFSYTVGTVSVKPFVITSATLTPTVLPDSGGNVRIEFTGDYVTAKVTVVGPGGYSLTANSSSGVANLPLPANTTDKPQVYTFTITDYYGGTFSYTVGTVSVKPFVITSATLTPTVLPDSGGNVRIEFTGDYVTAKVTVVGPGGYSLTANSSSGVANLPLPANTTDKPQVYTFTITDYYGGTFSYTVGTVSVKPFVITSATLTPTVLPDSGGNVRIEFTGDYVTAKVTVVGPGGYSLTANSSSGVANLPLPANTTDKPQVYTFTITDYYGGTFSYTVGTVTVGKPRTISGVVQLEYCSPLAQAITFTLRPVIGHNPTTVTQTLGADGSFSLTGLQSVKYTLAIKGPQWLQKSGLVDLTSADLQNLNVTLLTGDVDDNNVVDMNDLAILLFAFNTAAGDGSYDPSADLDHNGLVDVDDLTDLLFNFNMAGDN